QHARGIAGIVLVVGDLEGIRPAAGQYVAFHRDRAAADGKREHHQASAPRRFARPLDEEAAVRSAAGERAAVASLPAAALEIQESADPLRRFVAILQFTVLELALVGEAPLEPAQLVARLPRVRFLQQAVAVPARPEQRTPGLVRHVRTMRVRERL